MPPRGFERIGISLVGLIAIICVMVAGAVIWLMLTDPLSVATAVDAGDVSPFAKDLAKVILDAIKGLLSYL